MYVALKQLKPSVASSFPVHSIVVVDWVDVVPFCFEPRYLK